MRVLLGGVLGESAALAAEPAPRARLVYTRGAGAEGCPEEAEVHDALSARLGYDPFDAAATDEFKVSISARGKGLTAVVELFDTQGTRRGERTLTSPTRECGELAASFELALAIAIDDIKRVAPLSPPPGPLSPDAPDPASPPPSELRPLADPPGRPERTGRADAEAPSPVPNTSVEVNLGAAGSSGAAPSLTGGARAGVALRAGRGSLGVEVRWDLPGYQPVDSGFIRGSLTTGAVVPCLRSTHLGACALISVGSMQGAGVGLLLASSATSPYFSLGARVFGDLPLLHGLAARAHLDLEAPLARTVFTVSNTEVWAMPGLSVSLGLGLVATFE